MCLRMGIATMAKGKKMPRLIDVEKLAEYKASGISELTEWQEGWNDAIDTIMNETPTVEAVPVAELPYTVWLTHDVVQVVRCKDCKYADWWGPKGREVLDCTHLYVPHVTPEWYCAWGEKREND